jgi:TonB family protein
MKSGALWLLTLAALLLLQASPIVVGQNSSQQSASTPAADWERYTYPGEEFSVELPAMPYLYHTLRYVKASMGEFEGMRVFGLYADGAIFMIVSYDNPHSGESLDYFATYTHTKRWYSSSSKEAVTQDGFTGNQYSLASLHGIAKVFRTQKHVYLIQAFSTEENHPSVGRFFRSLRLTQNPTGTSVAEETTITFARLNKRKGDDVGQYGYPLHSSGAAGEALKPSEVTQKALIAYKPEPGFTNEARQKNVTGSIRLRCVLASSGKVKDIAVLQELPAGLTEEAVKAAAHILFFPALKDKVPASQYVVVEYDFSIY